jgi:hypothetical protein
VALPVGFPVKAIDMPTKPRFRFESTFFPRVSVPPFWPPLLSAKQVPDLKEYAFPLKWSLAEAGPHEISAGCPLINCSFV